MLTQERLRHLAIEAYRRSLISLRKLGKFLGKNYEEVRKFVYDAQIEVV
jgi:predicted HTH domain antitoxin